MTYELNTTRVTITEQEAKFCLQLLNLYRDLDVANADELYAMINEMATMDKSVEMLTYNYDGEDIKLHMEVK